jgi:O-antigen ligase/polysaccharide polymerase Wzy-like membrane protein
MLMAFLPLGWVAISKVSSNVKYDDSAIKLFHLSFIPLAFCCIYASFRKNVFDFVKRYRFLIGSFLLLMAMNFISTSINEIVSPLAKMYIIKNLVYFSFFILFGGLCLSLFQLKEKMKVFSVGAFLSVLVFIIVTSFTYKGGIYIVELVKYFATGNLMGLRYGLFKSLYNGGSVEKGSDFATALINTITGSFIFAHFIALYAYFNSPSLKYKILNIISLTVSFFFVISSISRSNIIALLFGYLVYWGLEIILKKNLKIVLSLLGGLAVIAAFVIFALSNTAVQTALSSTSSMYQERFEDLDENVRWQMNSQALQIIFSDPKHLVFGLGSGALLYSAQYAFIDNDKSVHNFIIGSTFQAGIFGLILSCFFYFSQFFYLIRYAPALSKYHKIFAIAGVMSVPLIRQMESGNSGSLTFQEWFCLAFFLGIILSATSGQFKRELYVEEEK